MLWSREFMEAVLSLPLLFRAGDVSSPCDGPIMTPTAGESLRLNLTVRGRPRLRRMSLHLVELED
ncbi:uncharacterized protein J3R85_013990 [Psidium guajava]|nr:uncharacterized protein J3R85_013990 [Psidium guajava]